MQKLLPVFSLSIFFTLISPFSFSQTEQSKMICDSAFVLTSKQFDSVVNKSLTLLNNKKLSDITADEHRAIIRSFNTIWMFEFDAPKYKKAIYGGLMAVLEKDNYSTAILKLYPGWCPNKGMGMYFFKLNIEYGGTPCRWSYFTIKD